MSKFYNGIMGLVVGDALGVPVEFRKRDTYEVKDMIGFGTYNQKPGTWSDDSSLTLATVESMGRKGGIDLEDIMKNFLDWLEGGWFTPYGEVFDVGNTTRAAIQRFKNGTDPVNCGGKTIYDNGNGSLMRILPFAFVPHTWADVLHASALTHGHILSILGCEIYVAYAERLIAGRNKLEAMTDAMKEIPFAYDFRELDKIGSRKRDEIKSSGYVVDTLEAALWCFLNTETYRDCVLAAVNLGEDTDTVAAVAGGLAGIYYGTGGEAGIPESWIEQIARKDWIREICDAVQLGDGGSR